MFGLTALLFSTSALADEGMWTFDNFPKAAVKEKHGVDVTDAWLQRIQRSTTRHESGCTGSFVSPDGLVLTNHHCVMECLSELSGPGQDYVELAKRAGFDLVSTRGIFPTVPVLTRLIRRHPRRLRPLQRHPAVIVEGYS